MWNALFSMMDYESNRTISDLTKPVSFLYEKKKIREVFSGFVDHCNII